MHGNSTLQLGDRRRGYARMRDSNDDNERYRGLDCDYDRKMLVGAESLGLAHGMRCINDPAMVTHWRHAESIESRWTNALGRGRDSDLDSRWLPHESEVSKPDSDNGWLACCFTPYNEGRTQGSPRTERGMAGQPLRIVGYVRVSAQSEQARHGESIGVQRERISRYLELSDAELIFTISDDGVSRQIAGPTRIPKGPTDASGR